MPAPPFTITSEVLRRMAAIERSLGRFEGLQVGQPQPMLRKRNRVRTVQASVGLEGNSFTVDQVTAVLEGKRVVGDRRELLEVQNALAAYDLANTLQPGRERDLLRAHGVLMKGLRPDAGRYRVGAVGVMKGSKVAHVAPPWKRVPSLVAAQLQWLATDERPMLVKAVVTHYELLFIHPFADGNGRLARLWQHVALLGVSPVFSAAPTESLIRDRQSAYYDALGRSDRAGDSTPFLEFGLGALADALEELMGTLRPPASTPEARLAAFSQSVNRGWFTRADYLRVHKAVSTATASRDLALGVASGALEKAGAHRLTRYRFRRRPG